MSANLHEEVKKLARTMSVLLVEDDELTLGIYETIFKDLFLKVYVAKDGLQACEIWNNLAQKIDLIITDIMMPNLDGFGLIDKIRECSCTQHVIVLTSVNDLNEMRSIINAGVDGIILKPYDQEKVLPVLRRVLEVIKNKKIMKRQIFQLKLLSQDNVALKITDKIAAKKETIKEEPQIKEDSASKKENSELSNKYNIRKTVVGSDAMNLDEIVSYDHLDGIDAILGDIQDMESLLISLESEEPEQIIDHLIDSTRLIYQLANIMEDIGSFNVAVEASRNLIQFIKHLDVAKLENREKKELFFDAYLSMLQDIEKWLNMVFIEKKASNINYFDASFANTCLELETIFMDEIVDDSDLEFF
jgi:YesN/AraC family two-component response regulator